MDIDVLGTKYKVEALTSKVDPRLVGDTAGYVDPTVKKIVVESIVEYEGDVMALDDLTVYARKNLRHEIIHAFLYESGLTHDYFGDETLVDWLATQFSKIHKAMVDAECDY